MYLPFYAYFLGVCYIYKNRLHAQKKNLHFSKLVNWLIIIPLLCTITYWANGQSSWLTHPTTVISLCGGLTFVIYYVLHCLRINERTIMMLVISLSLCILIIQVVQQFSPGSAIFGVKSYLEENTLLSAQADIEQRNGLYRFRISGTILTVLSFCYFWQKILKKRTPINILLFALFAVSIYLYLTRQRMLSAVGMCIFSVFLMGKSKFSGRFKYLILVLIFLFVIYSFSDVLFGSLIEQTQTQTEAAETDIRTLAFGYYWNEIVSHPLTFLFGAGTLSAATEEGTMWGMNWNDIGIIGQWFLWGIGVVLSYIYILYQFFIKKANEIPPYVKFFAFMTLITSVMIFPYRDPCEFFVWGCLFYICDLHINNSTLAIKN